MCDKDISLEWWPWQHLAQSYIDLGFDRMKRMMLGLEPFVYDFGILTEGYQHYTR